MFIKFYSFLFVLPVTVKQWCLKIATHNTQYVYKVTRIINTVMAIYA